MELDRMMKELDGAESVVRSATPEKPVPDRKVVIEVIKHLQALIFPGYFSSEAVRREGLTGAALLLHACEKLKDQIRKAAAFREEPLDVDAAAEAFFARLPAVKALLMKDIVALYEGDPAAKCNEEVLLCYPGFYAVTIFRLAHELYQLKVPLIPRIMTEYAHEKTGIDIHAGATIGEYFCIDHGTGIVVGETTVIGDHVKLYQGVTLGARSFELDENGNPVKDIKRHPNIGNNVVIYANATILGGDTFIGDNCVIGGSVWLTRSVPAGSTVYYKPPQS